MKIEIVHCPTWTNNKAKVASLVTLIKERLGIEAVKVPGATGQFDVVVDGQTIATRGGNWLTRSFGAGYPELHSIIERIKRHSASDAAR